jgi:hypothetical protein
VARNKPRPNGETKPKAPRLRRMTFTPGREMAKTIHSEKQGTEGYTIEDIIRARLEHSYKLHPEPIFSSVALASA